MPDLVSLILKYLPYIFLILLLFVIIIIILKCRRHEEIYPYEKAKFLLSENEKQAYYALLPIAEEYGFTVCPKVRLADIVLVEKGTEEYMKWFNKIKAKHVDMVLCDKELNIVLAVEVDDPSHDRADRIERDEFVDKIYDKIGLPIIHLRNWNEEELLAMVIDALDL